MRVSELVRGLFPSALLLAENEFARINEKAHGKKEEGGGEEERGERAFSSYESFRERKN